MTEISYNVIFSRRRSISIIVRPDKSVTVRAPLRTSLKTIDRFVRAKSAWIQKHLNNNPGIKLAGNDKEHINGEIFLYQGKEYKLQKILSFESFVKINGDTIEVGLADINDTLRTRYLLNRWYVLKAHKYLAERLRDMLNRYKELSFEPSGLTIRQLKSRWGSCSSKGKITLNSELIKLDPVLIDYVIVHELCHLKHHNHGYDFHKLLGELIPEYKSLRKELRKYLTR
ncbi:MAG TPA: SprT family zinc-dependent metalloprotease [Bacteroidales bacterium]|nr:SprT family zinc-dependent metalloprotease [Bacteroidales bacterium]